MAETSWLDLPYQSLSRENVRAEAAKRGLTLRKLMALYYHHDRERAVQLSVSWCVSRKQPEQLFGKAQIDRFVGDLTECLKEGRVKLTLTGDSLDALRGRKKKQHGKDSQQQPPQQNPGSSNPRKRKRGGNRKPKDARRKKRRHREASAAAPPQLASSVLYEDRDGNKFRFTASGVEPVQVAKPPAKRSKKRARRSPSTSSSSSSASSSSHSSSSSSSSSSSGSTNSFCEWLFAPSSSSESSSSSEDEDPPRAEPSASTKGDDAVPAAKAASPSPELEVIYSKPPERVDDDRWTKAFRRALPAEEEKEPQL